MATIYTKNDLDQVDRNIANGVLMIRHGDTITHFRTMKEMLRAREHIASQLAAKSSRTVANYSNGLRRGYRGC